MKITKLLQQATGRLSSVSPTARLDAEVLVAHALGLSRAALLTAESRSLTATEQQRVESLIARRERGEPVAYLTGEREFWSLPLAVSPAVLIPRPETELLVERALARIPSDAEASVADLGTGSGALALAIARERPRAQVTATDASPEALRIARANADRLHLTRIRFAPGDWLAAIPEGRFDAIVSNPPYIPSGDSHLQQGDVRFEPQAALVAGKDGLDAIRVIVRDARHHLRPGGWLLLEHGHDQGGDVAGLLEQSGYQDIRLYRDLAGHGRVTEARAP